MLFTDLLPQLLGQSPVPMPLGGPAPAMLPKAQSNAMTSPLLGAINIPNRIDPVAAANAFTQARLAPSEIALREAQGKLFGAQGAFQQARLDLLNNPEKLMSIMGGGIVGGEAPGADTGVFGGGVSSGGSASGSVGRGGGAGSFDMPSLYNLAVQAGYEPGDKAATAAAIAMAESNGNPLAHNTKGEDSRGLMQINGDAWGPLSVFDPVKNMQNSLHISKGGTDFHDWSTYKNGAYRQYLPAALEAAKAQPLPAVPDFAGRFAGNEGEGYAPTSFPSGSTPLADTIGTANVGSGGAMSAPIGAGGPTLGAPGGTPIRLAQAGTQAAPMSLSPSVAPQLTPGGGTSAQVRNALGRAMYLEMLGFPQAGQALMTSIYNSPAFQAEQARAKAVATAPFTDYTKAQMAAQMFPEGSPQRAMAEAAAAKAAGVTPIIGGERPGVPLRRYNSATGQYDIIGQNPRVGDAQLIGPNGEISVAPGGPEAARQMAIANRGPITLGPTQSLYQQPLIPSVAPSAPGAANLGVGGQLQTAAAPTGDGTLVHGLTPEQIKTQEGRADILNAEYKGVDEAYVNAQKSLIPLLSIEGAMNDYRTGPSAERRLSLQKAWQDFAQTVGLPQDSSLAKAIASGEIISKSGTYLGFDLAKTLGSREAQMIVQQSIRANPGLANSPEGNAKLIGLIKAGLQRDMDKREFYDNWYIAHNKSYDGAAIAFNKAAPVQSYISTILPPMVRTKAEMDALPGGVQFQVPEKLPNGQYRIKHKPFDPMHDQYLGNR